jgi:hypothetical protein
VGLFAAFVADVESVELMEPGEGALDDPAPAAESGAVVGHAARDQRCDAECAQLAAVELVVVAAIGDDTLGPSFRWAGSSAYRRDRLHQQQELGAVVSVGAGERPGQRQTAAVG